jgi:hypothetical protein
MERRYQTRLEELRADAEVPPGLLRGALARLEGFLEPFVSSLLVAEQRTNARHYVQGLVSDLPSKDAESIAYLHDRDRQGLQKAGSKEAQDRHLAASRLAHWLAWSARGGHLLPPRARPSLVTAH